MKIPIFKSYIFISGSLLKNASSILSSPELFGVVQDIGDGTQVVVEAVVELEGGGLDELLDEPECVGLLELDDGGEEVEDCVDDDELAAGLKLKIFDSGKVVIVLIVEIHDLFPLVILVDVV